MNFHWRKKEYIRPEKISTPYQLLAVLILGLTPLATVFTYSSKLDYIAKWIPKMYAITAVCVVPLYLLFIFLMQTVFRHKMLGDKEFMNYIKETTKKGSSYTKIKI